MAAYSEARITVVFEMPGSEASRVSYVTTDWVKVEVSRPLVKMTAGNKPRILHFSSALKSNSHFPATNSPSLGTHHNQQFETPPRPTTRLVKRLKVDQRPLPAMPQPLELRDALRHGNDEACATDS